MFSSLILSLVMSTAPAPVIESDSLMINEIGRSKSGVRIGRSKSGVRIDSSKAEVRIGRSKSGSHWQI